MLFCLNLENCKKSLQDLLKDFPSAVDVITCPATPTHTRESMPARANRRWRADDPNNSACHSSGSCRRRLRGRWRWQQCICSGQSFLLGTPVAPADRAGGCPAFFLRAEGAGFLEMPQNFRHRVGDGQLVGAQFDLRVQRRFIRGGEGGEVFYFVFSGPE